MYPHVVRTENGFTIFELIITLSIIAVLSAVVFPTYMDKLAQAKGKVSQANMLQIKQAFVNHLYNSVLARHITEIPPEPEDNQMTIEWSNSATLFNGRTMAELFSDGKMIYNPYGNPYLYEILPETGTEEEGFRIEDPDIGLVMEFRP